ncbi:hypothetical protein BG005_004315 [Podila minutissima]|nr:hypothetical protein BG005_004315 [Podila minutissima]
MKSTFIFTTFALFLASSSSLLVSSAPTPVNPLAFNWCARFKNECRIVGQDYCGSNASITSKCDVVFNGDTCQKVNIAQCTCQSGTLRRDVTIQVRYNVLKATNGLCATVMM